MVALPVQGGPVPSAPVSYPAWWFERDVIPRLPSATNNPSPAWPADYPPADDYTAANIGQLKAIATQAAAELDATLPLPGAGAHIASLIYSWHNTSFSSVIRDDYAALNQGQLKAVAKLYYDRLAASGYNAQPLVSGQIYPWTTTSTDDDDYALSNLGQLKYTFSFVPASLAYGPGDIDKDGLDDAWETTYFPSITTRTGINDPDLDTLSNRVEYLLGINPLQVAEIVPGTSLSLLVFSP